MKLIKWGYIGLSKQWVKITFVQDNCYYDRISFCRKLFHWKHSDSVSCDVSAELATILENLAVECLTEYIKTHNHHSTKLLEI